MKEEDDSPLPIRFNPFKHHRNYLLRLLESASPDTIITLLDPVCTNYIDLYTGSLSTEEIGKQVVEILTSKGVLSSDQFLLWVNGHNGYRQIILKDQSEWIVRLGNESERFVHLHPSRSGPYTIRFKGSTLKTICLIKIYSPASNEIPSLEIVNKVRNLAGLSPINKLDPGKGILSYYKKFF